MSDRPLKHATDAVRRAGEELWWAARSLPGSSRHALAWRARHARGRSGQFRRPEDSDRARALTDLWDRRWNGKAPEWEALQAAFPQRWVRFHSLPESKQYPETPAEEAEIVRRHRTAITELLDGSPVESVIVLAVDYSARAGGSGWSKKVLLGAWPWRVAVDEIEPERRSYVWAKTAITAADLDQLIAATADDKGRFVIADAALNWLYLLYPGGADAFLPNPSARDMLRARHRDWLPSQPAGL